MTTLFLKIQKTTMITFSNKSYKTAMCAFSSKILSNDIHSSEKREDFQIPYKQQQPNDPHFWYAQESGVYNSKHSPITLPSNQNLNAAAHIFSYKHNGKTSFIDYSIGYQMSYAKLQSMVKSIAYGLQQQMGISKGDVVLMLLPNSVYFSAIFLGVLYLGAVTTTMNPLSSIIEIRKQTLDCNAKLAFTSPTRVEELKALGIVSVGVPENANFDPNHVDFLSFHKLISTEQSPLAPKTNQNDTAVILYSSGTTGPSKGVVLTHKNLVCGVELLVRFRASQYKNPNEENVYLAILPLFHIYGLIFFSMGLLSLGSSIVVMSKFTPNEIARAIFKYDITHFPVVPPLVTTLTKIGRSDYAYQLKSLKQVLCAAAPLKTKSIEDFVKTFPHVDIIQAYAMSESSGVGACGFNTEDTKNYSSAGLLAPNMQAKVVDSVTGLCLPPGITGELWLRGPAIMKEYLNNLEASSLTIDKDGWLHTGDIVYFDHEGFLYIVDRVKDIIKYKGFQIAPADLEDVLVSHPAIDDVAVIGVEDEEAGEVPMAFIVKKSEADISESDIIDYVAKQVAPQKKVRRVKFINAIPKSSIGKILRRELKYKFL